MPFEHEHHAVALFDAVLKEHVGRLIAQQADVPKSKGAFLALVVCPEQGPAVRFHLRQSVDTVVCKVKIIFIDRFEYVQDTVFVKRFLAELLIKVLRFHVVPPA